MMVSQLLLLNVHRPLQVQLHLLVLKNYLLMLSLVKVRSSRTLLILSLSLRLRVLLQTWPLMRHVRSSELALLQVSRVLKRLFKQSLMHILRSMALKLLKNFGTKRCKMNLVERSSLEPVQVVVFISVLKQFKAQLKLSLKAERRSVQLKRDKISS